MFKRIIRRTPVLIPLLALCLSFACAACTPRSRHYDVYYNAPPPPPHHHKGHYSAPPPPSHHHGTPPSAHAPRPTHDSAYKNYPVKNRNYR